MTAQDSLFGRAVRFTCDRRDCAARHTTTGEPPDGWQFIEADRSWRCPEHASDDAEFDSLCDELMGES
jgi:hypothetical protein